MIKKLDLHGIRHAEVDRMVENFVLLNDPPLRIITGNSGQMMDLVNKVLNRHDMEYENLLPGQVSIYKQGLQLSWESASLALKRSQVRFLSAPQTCYTLLQLNNCKLSEIFVYYSMINKEKYQWKTQ